jgi:hypothetical protein
LVTLSIRKHSQASQYVEVAGRSPLQVRAQPKVQGESNRHSKDEKTHDCEVFWRVAHI